MNHYKIKNYSADKLGNLYYKGNLKAVRLHRTGYMTGKRYCSKTKKQKSFYAHRLVYECFFGKIPDDLQINHRDCNKQNNATRNLELVTAKENMQHAKQMGRLSAVIGEGVAHPQAKLTEAAVLEIRRAYAAKELHQYQLSKKYLVSQKMISKIVRREKWKHI